LVDFDKVSVFQNFIEIFRSKPEFEVFWGNLLVSPDGTALQIEPHNFTLSGQKISRVLHDHDVDIGEMTGFEGKDSIDSGQQTLIV
jgi:hypothetical protein